MIAINGRDIEITRGDCHPFTITLTGNDVPEDGEKVLFTVKRDSTSNTPLIEKLLEVSDGKVLIRITNADTKEIPFGTYQWDIRFPNLMGDGEPWTPMYPAKFAIVKVIGDV